MLISTNMAVSEIKVHFMGIGGAGMSAVAAYALKKGYQVSGCDQDINSPYISKLKEKIEIKEGHSVKHNKNTDLLVVTPAVYFQRPQPEELYEFNNVMTWQTFLGKYLQKRKKVICVSGTHGKSTTTALLSLVFDKAGKRPNVMVGATIPSWETNFRFRKSKFFITEADEFYDSFLNYTPETIILNNIEYDHPDYFRNRNEVIESFRKHVMSLKMKRILIANIDSEGVRILLKDIKNKNPDMKIYTYSIRNKFTKVDMVAKIVERAPEGTRFRVKSENLKLNEEFFMKLPGDFNVSNALGVIMLSLLYSIKLETIKKVLESFKGIGRRMELLGTPKGVFVYDDYAHHPTAIEETLKAIRQRHPVSRIYAVIEPHSYSRTHALIKSYVGIFKEAYAVIIAPIFKARDTQKFDINEQKLARVIDHDKTVIGTSFNQIADNLSKELRPKDVVLVMGAGKSHELARKIVEAI